MSLVATLEAWLNGDRGDAGAATEICVSLDAMLLQRLAACAHADGRSLAAEVAYAVLTVVQAFESVYAADRGDDPRVLALLHQYEREERDRR
jgi:hypothetical protein